MNILVIRTHRLGDILQLTPMLRGLKNRHPTCTLTILTGEDMVDLVSNNPDIDEIMTIPEKKYRYYVKEKPGCYAHVYNRMNDLMAELSQRNFRLVINRQYEWGAIIAGSIGEGDVRGGTYSPVKGFHFSDEQSQDLLQIIKKDRRLNRRNLVDWSCRIAGVEAGTETMHFSPTVMDRLKAQDIFEEAGISCGERPIAIQPGAARSFRQWGITRYRALISWLSESKNKKIILLGSADEKKQAEELRHAVSPAFGHVVDLTGKTTLQTLGAVLERCECLITGDTGTMHMSAAVGTPVLALFYGTAYPWETGPYGNGHFILHADTECTPCNNPEKCAFDHRCRSAITPDHVSRAYEIFEQRIRGVAAPVTWSAADVNLYCTCIRQGEGQVLVPAGDIPTEHVSFTPLPAGHTTGVVNILGELSEITHGFESQGAAILRDYFIGNHEKFLTGFGNFVADWTTFLFHMKKSHACGNLHDEIARMLFPVIIEATRAMECNDLVSISDLIRYDFIALIANMERMAQVNRKYEARV